MNESAVWGELQAGAGALLVAYLFQWFVFTGWVKKGDARTWHFVSTAAAAVASLTQAIALIVALSLLSNAHVTDIAGIDIGVWTIIAAALWLVPGVWVWFSAMRRLNPALGYPVGIVLALTGIVGAAAWYLLSAHIERWFFVVASGGEAAESGGTI